MDLIYTVVLIYMSMMISYTEQIFMCLLATCISLEKCLFRSFACLKIGDFFVVYL